MQEEAERPYQSTRHRPLPSRGLSTLPRLFLEVSLELFLLPFEAIHVAARQISQDLRNTSPKFGSLPLYAPILGRTIGGDVVWVFRTRLEDGSSEGEGALELLFASVGGGGGDVPGGPPCIGHLPQPFPPSCRPGGLLSPAIGID